MKGTYRLDYPDGGVGLFRASGPSSAIAAAVEGFEKLGARATAIDSKEAARVRRLINAASRVALRGSLPDTSL